VPDPDGRPWWDKPIWEGGIRIPDPVPVEKNIVSDLTETADDFQSPAEMDQEKIAQHAIDVAMESIHGGTKAPGGKTFAEPTPEKRAFLAPFATEKGFHDPHPDWPEILHGPYKAFSEMYALLAGGARASDPEVVKRAAEVAGGVIGGGLIVEKAVTERGALKAIREAGLEGQRPPPEVVAEAAPRPKPKNKPASEVPRELDEAGFYSQLKETVQKLGKSEAHPTEYMALLEPGRSGVKEAEIRATDLDKHLLGDEVAEMRRVIIDSKEGLSEITKSLKEAEIKLSRTTNSHDEKVLKEEIAQHKADIEEVKNMIKHGVAIYNDKTKGLRANPETRSRDDLVKHVEENRTIVEEKDYRYGKKDQKNIEFLENPEDAVPHGRYSTDPRNPTMHEIELTIRNPEAEAKLAAIEKKMKAIEEKRAAIVKDEIERNKKRPIMGEDYTGEKLSPEAKKIFDEHDRLSKERAAIQDEAYHSEGHFTQNTAAWYMASIQTGKDGRKAFVTHQVQSDWGQAAREGMQNPGEIKRLKEAVKTAQENVSKIPESLTNKGLIDMLGEVDKVAAMKVADKVHATPAGLRDKEVYALQEAIVAYPQNWQLGLTHNLRHNLIDRDIAASLQLKIDASPEAKAILKTVTEDYEKVNAVKIAKRKLEDALEKPPYHPMVASTSQWVDLAVKRIIKDAVESGADSIAIPHGRTVQGYTGGSQTGQIKFYEGILPRRLEKALKDMDPSIEGEMAKDLRAHDKSPLKYESRGHGPAVARFTEFPLTDAVREKAKKGFKLYTRGPAGVPPQEENQ